MKALVLCSGGVDSATCLALAVQQYTATEVLALSVSYGQKHQKELDAAKAVADYYGVPLITLDLAAVFAGSDCSLLEGSAQDIPAASYARRYRPMCRFATGCSSPARRAWRSRTGAR